MSAPVELEYKTVAVAESAAPPDQGIVEALVAVTGVRDDVGDIIVPGAFAKTLASRKPKVCMGHDWNRPIGKTLDIKELMPGDPALPKTTADGKPWPKEAGAVWARYQANLDSDDGKSAFQSAKFFGTEESTYSIGYKTTSAKHKGNTRYIHELDLFEFGPVLHPANRLATLQSIKSGEPEGIEYTDSDAADEEKGVTVEELTLRDYAAILDIMEEKVAKVRRVADSAYWGLPVGTIIKPGMKPRGTGEGGTTNRGLTTRKPANAPKAPAVKAGEHAVTRDGYAGLVSAVRGDKVLMSKPGEAIKTFDLRDVSRGVATPDTPITLKPTTAMDQAADNIFRENDEEAGATYENGMLVITDLGRAIDAVDDELDIMEDNPERKKSAGASTRALRKKLVSLVDFDDDDDDDAPQGEDAKPEKPAPKADAAPPSTSAEPDKAPKRDAPAEDLAKVQKVGEELGMEVRANPGPPEYAIWPPKELGQFADRVMSFRSDTGKARANNGQIISAGRVEEFLRTWDREYRKSGSAPRADWVLSQMDAPAREAAAKAESERKRREALASATDEQIQGQGEFEVDRLTRLKDRMSEGVGDPAQFERSLAYVRGNLALVNEERAKRGQPVFDDPTASRLSTKPTGGRPVQEILDSIPNTREGQAPRYNIENGADVIDEPGGSGVFAVGPRKDATKDQRGAWVITLGNGLSIPASGLVRAQSNENGIDVSTPKKVTAWLKAMGELRGPDGNPPPYGTATGPELLAWRDAEGRTLRNALVDTVVPAYLKAIGKKGEISDKSTPAKWKNAPLVAANKLPTAMYNEFTALNSNAKQVYILGRTEGDDHATALQRAKDTIANARVTGPEYAPVNREERIQAAMRDAEAAYDAAESRPPAAADDNQLQPTPEGEISTDQLLMLNRNTGPAKIAAMEIAELERHDAELTRRAAELGKPGEVSPAHRAIKNALLRKRLDARQGAADRARAESAPSDPDTIRERINRLPTSAAVARQRGVRTRTGAALREISNEIDFGNASGNLYNLADKPGTSGREDGLYVAELAKGAETPEEMQARADIADRVADRIEDLELVLGDDSDYPRRLRQWAAGVRAGVRQWQQESASLEDGRTLTAATPQSGEDQALELTSGNLTLRVYKLRRPSEPGKPWAYDIVNNATGEKTEGEGLYSSPGSALVRAESEFQAAEQQQNRTGLSLVGEVSGNARAWRQLSNEDLVTAFATARTMAGSSTGTQAAVARRQLVELQQEMRTRRDTGQELPPIPAAEAPAPLRSAGPSPAVLAEMQRYRAMSDEELDAALSAARLRAQTDASARNEIMAIRRELDARESARRDVPRAPDAPAAQPEPAPVATIAPELLDEAAESEAASVGLSETPDGVLEVEPEVAERQDRVEKLIKDADAGKLDLSAKSTDELTGTRRDLVDELRLQTAMRRRTPTNRATLRATAPADAPKVRPGLAGAAEDHAEALRSGDEAAIARTRARLESSIRRSRADSEIARSLADTVTSRDDSDADQLSDLAKRLRAESRERRNAAARKRRTAKRIERERLQALLGAVDTELRGRGVELEQVAPELLAPDAGNPARPSLTDKQKAVLLAARPDGQVSGNGNTMYSLSSHGLIEQRTDGTPRTDVERRQGYTWWLTPDGLAEVELLRSGDSDDGPPVPSVRIEDVRPGLRFEYQGVEVEVLTPPEDYEDRFGRMMLRFRGRRADTGKEGWMEYGPGAEVYNVRT